MTTPPRLLNDRLGSGPVSIQLTDKTFYIENDRSIIDNLIVSESVEGVGPRSGRIKFLRMMFGPEEAASRIAAIPPKEVECRGSSADLGCPSKETFIEKLCGGEFSLTQHKRSRLDGFALNRFNPDLMRGALQHVKLYPPLKKAA